MGKLSITVEEFDLSMAEKLEALGFVKITTDTWELGWLEKFGLGLVLNGKEGDWRWSAKLTGSLFKSSTNYGTLDDLDEWVRTETRGIISIYKRL